MVRGRDAERLRATAGVVVGHGEEGEDGTERRMTARGGRGRPTEEGGVNSRPTTPFPSPTSTSITSSAVHAVLIPASQSTADLPPAPPTRSPHTPTVPPVSAQLPAGGRPIATTTTVQSSPPASVAIFLPDQLDVIFSIVQAAVPALFSLPLRSRRGLHHMHGEAPPWTKAEIDGEK
ncbi:protein kinase superfamily protein [Striga asiatica]|uniref:Protein kinase superfamily protein n=1 Tax=Striga asiatica TaxID=4170 RepID=A0A5A7RIP1_STRAF|nr:protein kinase superfamily protein [Striga asiatica]